MLMLRLYKIICLNIFILASTYFKVSAQESKLYIRQLNGVDDTIYQSPRQKAEFPDGEAALFKFFSKNLIYPKIAIKNGVHGVVYVSIVVERDGSISITKLIKGIGSGCDEEAIRILKLMPRWKSAKQNGKPVASLYSLPIRFEFD